MSLADGMAAIVGVTWGRRTNYMVFRHPKSLVGSTTFFVVSLAILFGFSALSGTALNLGIIIGLASMATAIENLGVAGLDNLLVPVLIGVALTRVA